MTDNILPSHKSMKVRHKNQFNVKTPEDFHQCFISAMDITHDDRILLADHANISSMFCCTLLYVHSSIAIILFGKRQLIALLNLSSWCLVMVERLFLTVPRGCLQFVIVVFPDHTHLLFLV